MRAFLAIAGTALIATPASAAIDLSSWTAEGAGTWVLGSGNTSVTQTQNSDPTVFFSPASALNKTLKGKVSVAKTGDNDFFGFVVGFNSGGLTSLGDFHVIDWRQATETGLGCTSTVGMAISKATAGLGKNQGAWCHKGFGVTELARATTLGSTGWTDPASYEFELSYTDTNISFAVDGVEQFNLAGAFTDGAFGFYDFSQRGVTFSDVTVSAISAPVPEPTSWALMIVGMGAVAGALRSRRKTSYSFA